MAPRLTHNQIEVNHCTWFLCPIIVKSDDVWHETTEALSSFSKNNIHLNRKCIEIHKFSWYFCDLSSNLWVRGEWNIVMKKIILAKNQNTHIQKWKIISFSGVSFDVFSCVLSFSIPSDFCAWLHRIHTRWNFQDSNVLYAMHDIYDSRWWNKIILQTIIIYFIFLYDCL